MLKYLFFFAFDLLLFIAAPEGMDSQFMLLVLLTAILSTSLFFTDKTDSLYFVTHNQYFTHSILFVICFFVVSFQCDIDYVLGIVDSSDYYLWQSGKAVSKAIALSNLGLVSLMIGYRSYTNNKFKESSAAEDITNKFSKKRIVLIVAIALVIFLVFAPKVYFSGIEGRGQGGAVQSLLGYIQAGYIAMFVIYCIDFMKNKRANWFNCFRIPLFLVLVYVFLILVTGRRTEAIKIGGIVFFAYIYCKNQSVNYKLIFILCCLIMFVFSLIGIYRSLETRSLQEGIAILNSSNSVLPFTRELAGSVNNLHIAIEHYPHNYPYNWGSSFLPPFLKLIPGSYSLWNNIFGASQVSGEIFTDIYFGKGNWRWGLGSQITADIFISFGSIGVCLVYFIFGRFLKLMDYMMFVSVKSPFMLALTMGAYSSYVFAGRSGIPMIFLCWSYSCLFIYVSQKK